MPVFFFLYSLQSLHHFVHAWSVTGRNGKNRGQVEDRDLIVQLVFSIRQLHGYKNIIDAQLSVEWCMDGLSAIQKRKIGFKPVEIVRIVYAIAYSLADRCGCKSRTRSMGVIYFLSLFLQYSCQPYGHLQMVSGGGHINKEIQHVLLEQ